MVVNKGSFARAERKIGVNVTVPVSMLSFFKESILIKNLEFICNIKKNPYYWETPHHLPSFYETHSLFPSHKTLSNQPTHPTTKMKMTRPVSLKFRFNTHNKPLKKYS